MKKVTTIVRNLDQLSTYITDQSSLSSNIFNITEFPLEFTIGKNLIKLKGNTNIFEVGTELAIEILDSNRNPIYHEIIDYIESDTSRVLAVYIYDTTPPGNCTVTIAAVLNQLYTGEQIPTVWRNKLNVKWIKNVSVNNKATNTSEIIFEDTKLPTVEVSEQIGVRLDRIYENNEQFPTYTTGLIEFETRNNSILAKITGGEFDPKFSGGTLTVTNPVNALPIPLLTTSSAKPYTSKIKKILNKDFIELDDRYVFTYSQSLTQHEFIKFDASPFSLSYEAVPTYIPTQHSESFALTQIKNLNPGTGDVSRIKLYINSSGTIGTYELINDISLEPTEIFVDATGSIFPDVSIGYFTSQSIIDSYWEVNQYNGKNTVTKPTLTFSTSSLNNSLIVTPSVSYSGDQNAIVLQTTSSLPGVFVKDSEYKIIFDAIGTKNSLSNLENPKISIYLSGSSFDYDNTNLQNDYFPYILGKKIGEYETPNNNQRLDDLQFNFTADKTGNGSLLILIESGQWQFSDIRTLTSAEKGFTENYTRFRTDIPVKHKSDNEIKFKIEYYNAAGVKSDHETIVTNQVFQGGNRYIDGGFSMLTGSLTVADTLNSGVEIVGLQNTGYIRSLGYDGFNQAMTGRGGFLLFSGSALPNQFATSYQGVGLEMVANANNFFKFRTDPSGLEIQTEKFFLGNPSTQFISGSNGQLEISSSGYHIQPSGDITASNFLMEGGVITNNVTILGSVSANSILTPAVINGSPATPSNASSSISDQGLAIFRSASIAGFNISPEEIRSPGDALRLKSIGQITASDGFLFGSKAASNFIQFAGSTLTVRGDLSVDQIFTPALIGGSPANETNASSSIKSDGFAKFVSASIGGWGITTSSIEGGNLIMKPEGILQTRDFASGFKGWKISSEGNGTAEFENVRIRGTLRTTTFEKESVNAVGGQLWVTNATTLTGSNITANATTMSVENASGFAVGEILLAKKVDATGFQTEYLLVESASVDGNNTGSDEVHGRIFVQRGYGSGSGGSFVGDLASTSQSYDEGQVIVSTGLSGSGYIKMNANPRDSNTPFIDIVERTGSGLYDVELRSRLGDLSGLANSSYVFGNPSPGFGLATDNVFLQGGIIARTGSIGGIEMEAGKLYIGAGNHANTDTGFYVDSGSNFSLGDKLTWDGSALVVRGQLRLEDGQNVQDAINEATASNTAKSLTLTSDSQIMAFDSASDNTATPSSIIFSITQQNLTASISASNITITTAQSTNVTGFNFDTGSITVNSSGLYSGIVSGSITFAGALSAGGLETDKDNFPVSITVNGDSLTDTTSLFKVQGGSDGNNGLNGSNAKSLIASVDSQVFSFDSASDTSADPSSIIFSFNQQNLSDAVAASDITITTALDSNVTNFSFDNNSVTNSSGKHSGISSGSISFSSNLNAGGLNSNKLNLPVTIEVSNDSLSDTIKVFKVEGGSTGSDGTDGTDAVTAFLTNEAHTFAAQNDGTIVSFNGATTDMEVFEGITNVTSNYTFTGSNSIGVTATSASNQITVTGMAHDSGSINFTAVSASVSLTKTMTLAKSKQGTEGLSGADAKLLTLTSDSQVFSFASASSNIALDNDILFIINQQNLSTAIDSSEISIITANDTTVTGFTLDTDVTNNSGLFTGEVSGSITFTGALSSGGLNSDKTNLPLTITVTSGSLTDTTKIFKLEGGTSGVDGAAGTDAVTGFLTNESHTFPADQTGAIASFTGGETDMEVFEGITNVTSNYTFTGSNSNGITATSSSNSITITGMTVDSGSINFTAKSGSVTLTKIMSLAKSRQGESSITAFLTNESQTFVATSDGTVSDFSVGTTTMEVFNGLNNVTSSFTFTGSNTDGVTATSSSNDIQITGMSHDSGSITFTAKSGSGANEVSISKVFTLAKSKAGTDGNPGSSAKLITLTTDSQVFSFPSASSSDAIDNDILFIINQQNLDSAVVSSNITIKDSNGNTLTNPSLITDVTSGTGQVSGSITFSGTVGGDKTKLPLTIEVARDSVSDTTKIFKLEGGSSGSDGTNGSDGQAAITAFLSNESHTFPATADGTVPDFSTGTTEMIVFLGLDNVTSSFTFTGSNSLGVTATSSSNLLTVTGMAHDSGSINFTAVSGSVSLTKTMNLAKSKTGESGSTAKTLTLTSDSQVFSFASSSATDALDDDILIIFNQQNLSGPIVSGDIIIKDSTNSTLSNPTLKTDVTNGSGQVSGSITFSGTVSGNKTKLPLTIEVTKDSLSDTTRIFKLDGGSSGSDGSDGAPGADGAPAVTAFLTNESHTFPADQSGTVSSFADGVTDMVVFVGLTNSTSSFSYARTNSTGVTSTLSGTDGNTLTINSMTHDSGSVDITATSASVSVTKTMTLAKSKQGTAGTAGATGATGPNFDFLTGSISEVDTTGGLNAGLLMTSNVLGFHGNITAGDGTNATINDFVTFLDSSGNFFIGSASAGHFAYSQTTGQLLVSGSEVDIQTPKFFLGSVDNQFVSGANGNIEISSSKIHIKPDGDVIVRKVSAEEGTIGGFVLSADEIRSSNNNLRLKDSGQITGSDVLFTGGTIGGFDLTTNQINSTNNNIVLKDTGQITASNALFNGRVTAQQFTEKTVKVTNGNQSSYFRTVTGGKNLVFDGSLGGDVVMNMIIAVAPSNAFIIKDIELPNTGSASSVTSTSVNVIIQTPGIQFDTANINEAMDEAFDVVAI